MVCGALIADVLYDQFLWRKLPCTDHQGCFPIKEDNDSKKPYIASDEIMPAWNGEVGALLSLSKSDEITTKQNKPWPMWHYSKVVRRVEKKFSYSIIATAIIGTLIWGYAHLWVY
ncbi:hypothetical protein PRUB_a3411 [Pseudoalteromonas rubra]|uniref:Uncharacterized protein n=2 Tax=Pseudoalteromonas rubra TaxID=43658 RepID=A0A8T0C2T8_9GAMM|nr:hypothetical protein PRUB_a3411 [Pseudoalteromonas rubra]